MKFKPNISRLYPQRQVPRPSVYDLTNQQRRRGPSIDSDVAALLDFGTAQGYSLPSGATQGALSNYVTGLKDAGIWTKLDLLYVFATDGDSDFATLNLKDPNSFQCTKVNSPTFTSLEGFNGNGTSSYLNTGWDPTNNGSNFTLNSASLGFYGRNDEALNGVTMGGASGLTNSDSVYLNHNAADSANGRINSIVGFATPIANAQGFLVFNRNSSTVTTIYKNGSLVHTENPNNSASISAIDQYIGCFNNNGTAANFVTRQISIAFYGGSLVSEMSDFSTLTEAYMDAIGKGVL